MHSRQARSIASCAAQRANEITRFWRARGMPAYQLEIAQRVAGYFYVKDGVIGPAAWLDPS